MHDTMKIDPARLRRMRETRGWTQEQLAEIAGLNARTVQRVETSGKAAPETGMALAAVLACPLADLLAETAAPAGSPAVTPVQAGVGDRMPTALVAVLWLVAIVLMFLMAFGYRAGKDMAERDNVAQCRETGNGACSR